jgi:hypothetical protein
MDCVWELLSRHIASCIHYFIVLRSLPRWQHHDFSALLAASFFVFSGHIA